MSEEQNSNSQNTPEKKRNPVASVVVALVGVASTIYLLNPSMGVFEIIPDNLPVVGNIDEAGATALLISCLAYFGVDAGSIFGRFTKQTKEKEAKGEVIDG